MNENALILAGTVAAIALVAWLLAREPDDTMTVYPADELQPEQAGDLATADTVATEGADQLPTTLDTLAGAFSNPLSLFGGSSSADVVGADGDRNVRAFLDMIAAAEGTARYPDRGYRTMFGGEQCESLADHPRRFFTFTNGRGETLKTSAAGRYQFLSRTWDELARKLGLQSFEPWPQDVACIELIRQRGALDDVKAGRVHEAIAKCAKTWASLPGAGYAQPERKLSYLLAAYSNAGGVTAA